MKRQKGKNLRGICSALHMVLLNPTTILSTVNRKLCNEMSCAVHLKVTLVPILVGIESAGRKINSDGLGGERFLPYKTMSKNAVD